MAKFSPLVSKLLLPSYVLVLLLAVQNVFAQNSRQTSKEWYCDERLKLNLQVGTVIEIIPYKKYKKNGESAMAKFTQGNIKYETINVVKFETFDLFRGEKKI